MKKKFILIASLLFISAGIFFLFTNFSDENNSSLPKKDSVIVAAEKRDFIIAETKNDSLPLPDSLATIDTLLIAHKGNYRMNLYAKGKLLKTYHIALGQSPVGHKEKQGDNRTPEGEYKIIQKSRGPFYGDYAAYLGVAWMRLNYPNNADAINGFKKGLITEAQKNAIVTANNSGKEPPKNTPLGGGIGIHGWNGDWPGSDQQDLTWGCISMQNTDLSDLFTRVPLGTTILILP